MKKILLSPWLALITLAILILIRIIDPGFVESIRLRYFDQLIINQPTKELNIHVVDIDESTLDEYGQYPFPRDIYSKIIKDLYNRNAGLVVFNILMPEKDRFGKDTSLIDTLQQYPVVIPALGHTTNKNQTHSSAIQLLGLSAEGKLVQYPGMINSISEIATHSAGVGIVNTFPEIDGVVRRMPSLIAIDNNVYPSLGIETLRVASNDKIQVKIGVNGIDAIRIPSIGKFFTDELGRIWIDWSAVAQSHSAVNLPQSFDGKIVIVGVTAAGLNQPVSTSRGEVWPHHLQASVIGTLLSDTNIVRPQWADAGEVALLVILGLLIITFSRWTYIGIAFFVLSISGYLIFSIVTYNHYRWLIDATAPAFTLILVALHAYSLKFISEFLQKQQIRKQFSSYLSPDLVAKLIKDPSLLKLGGEEKELSIMFTDVRGFTSISEHYGKDVQGLTKIMNRYMTAMTQKILLNNGTLDKYIGDAQMAFWNAPIDETLHCKESVRAALDMLKDLDNFNNEIQKEGVPPFGMGIGINTGTVVVGNMGSEQRFDYTCLGDAVNLASRLEGQTKNYGVKIIIGPITAQRLGDGFFVIELDTIAVKGKNIGITIHTVFDNPDPKNRTQWETSLASHKTMLNLYRNQQWDSAIILVNKLMFEFDNNMQEYYKLWLDRIDEMRNMKLPDNWNGVYIANSK